MFSFFSCFFLTCVVFQGQVFFCCVLSFQLRVVPLLSFVFCCFFLFFPMWCIRFGVLDRCFLIGVFMCVCVCFQECFDIDLIGDLLCDFDW